MAKVKRKKEILKVDREIIGNSVRLKFTRNVQGYRREMFCPFCGHKMTPTIFTKNEWSCHWCFEEP